MPARLMHACDDFILTSQLCLLGVLLLLMPFMEVSAGLTCSNLTRFMTAREKRSLIFEGGGTLKLTIGPSIPVNLGDPISWRSLVCSYNLHGGHYTMPTVPLYPWDKYESIFARSMSQLSDGSSGNGGPITLSEELERAAAMEYWSDDSRLFVYTALESFMHKNDATNGRACLLRSICENAQVQQHVGVLAEVLNIILTPGKENLDGSYKAAHLAGKSGVDCLKMYKDCPMGSNILDYFLEFL